MHAKHHAGKGCAGDRGETTTCAAPGNEKERATRSSRCELLTASTTREPACELLSAAGGVKVLALAVTVHGSGDGTWSKRAAAQAAPETTLKWWASRTSVPPRV